MPTPSSIVNLMAMAGSPDLEEAPVGQVVRHLEAELPDLGNRVGDVALPQLLVAVHLDSPFHVERRVLRGGAAEHVECRRPPFLERRLGRRLALRGRADLPQMQKTGLGVEFLVGLELRRGPREGLVRASRPLHADIKPDAVDKRMEPREVDPVLERYMEGVLLDRALSGGIDAETLEHLLHDLSVRDLLLDD